MGLENQPNQGHARTSPSCGKGPARSKDLSQVLQRVAYVEQKSAIDFHFPITVRECISLGLYPHLSIFKRKSKEDLQKVENALKLVNLLDLADRQIGQLSGGQFQRVLIARCLVQEADVIFLDEPSQGLTPSAKTLSCRPFRP